MRLSETDCQCSIFTRKEGWLSKVAHDLELEVTRFSLDVDLEHGTCHARFDASSIRVVSATKNGERDPTALSSADKKTIERNIERDVLKTSQHPHVEFHSRSIQTNRNGHLQVNGELTLLGITRPLEVESTRQGAQEVFEFELHQPDFGIVPYQALMGTLRIQATLRIRLVIAGSALEGMRGPRAPDT